MSPLSIWLVEDEASIADTLIYSLETEGFTVRWFDRGLPVLAALESEQPAFLILDVGLPDIGGFELCRRIRAVSQLPLLFLTARSEEIDRLLGLEMGADDYVAKPFSPREVCARVRTILRRVRPATPAPTEKSRGQLLDLVWAPGEESLERTVDTHIKTLRAKLRDIDADANPILTHRGLGYSLSEPG
jgi:two-component system, OmpR family, catabolic regulation response regulator CreB